VALNSRLIEITDLEEIWVFESQKLKEQYPDEEERMIAGWSSRARKEAMEFYFNAGWSFLVREDQITVDRVNEKESPVLGYFLAQPFLFFEGQPQILWVEHVQYTSLESRDFLCDLAVRLAREKHFQKVIFPNNNALKNSLDSTHKCNFNGALMG